MLALAMVLTVQSPRQYRTTSLAAKMLRRRSVIDENNGLRDNNNTTGNQTPAAGNAAEADAVVGRVKIVIGFVQALSAFRMVTLSLAMPKVLQTFINWISMLTITPTISVLNEGRLSFYEQLVLHVALPFIWGALVFVTYTIPSRAMFYGEKESRHVWSSTVTLMLFGAYLMYPGISLVAMQALACEQIGSHSHLIADTSVQCYTSEWSGYAVLGTATLLLFGVGVPSAIAMILQRHRLHLDDPRTYMNFSFIYKCKHNTLSSSY